MKAASSRKKPEKPASFVDQLDPNTEISQATSSLEFLLLSFCKHFHLRPKQAAGLLTQGGKYLAHIVAKGLKGKAEPIVSWYQDLFAHVKHLVFLASQEVAMGSVTLILSTLKSGFVAKNIETVLWCCRVYSRLGEEFADNDLLPPAWEWFISEGLNGTLLACRRFGPDVKAAVMSVYVQFGRTHFLELFTVQLRKHIPELIHYLTIMNEFLPSICEIRTAKQELVAAGIPEYWLDLGLKEAVQERKYSPDIKLAAINLVCDIWVYLPSIVEANEELGSMIMTVLKRTCRDRHKLLKSACHAKLFHLLDAFSSDRNSYAPVIYKTLTFSLVENYSDDFSREFLLSNFVQSFKSIDTIPIGIVIEPLVKQLQVAEKLDVSLSEFEFFLAVARHPRLSVKHGVQVLDVLMKVYSTELRFSIAAAVPIMQIVSRFIGESLVQEYLFRAAQYTTKLIHNAVVHIARDKKALAQRDVMLDLLQSVLKLRCEPLNERIKAELLRENAVLKKAKGHNAQPIVILLKLLGDPNEIIAEYDRAGREVEAISASSAMNSRGEFEPRRKRAKAPVPLNTLTRRTLKPQLELQHLLPTRPAKPNEPLLTFAAEHQEGINILLKKHSRLLKLLFRKYSSSGYKGSNGREGFDRLSNVKSHLSVSEFYRLLKEQGVSSAMISLEEFSLLMKAFCHKLQRAEHRVNFKEFQELLVLTAIQIYSRPPKDLSHLPPVVSLKVLFDHFRNWAAAQGMSTRLFDEPDPGLGDRDVVKKLNKQLANDPNTPMPDGYKRVVEKDVVLRYDVPIPMPDSKRYAIVILDELLESLFGFHVLEPQLEFVQVYCAKGVVPSKQRQAVLGAQPPIELILSPAIKYEMARLNGLYSKNSEPLLVAAKVLEDLLYSVEKGSTELTKKTEKNVIKNRVILQRTLEQQKAEEQAEIREQRRQLRKQVVEEKLKQRKAEQELKAQFEYEQAEAERHAREEEQEAIQRRREAIQRRKRESLDEWKAQKEAQERQKQEELERIKAEVEINKRARVDEFLRKEQDKLSQLLKETKEKRNRATSLRQQKDAIAEAARKARREQVNQQLKQAKHQQEEDRKFDEQVQGMLKQKKVKQALDQYADALRTVFGHYKAMVRQPIVDHEFLDNYAYNRFITQFYIWPGLLRAEDTNKVFLVLTKRKPSEEGQRLVYSDFIEALLRFSVFGKEVLEEEMGVRLKNPEDAMKTLFDWMELPTTRKETLALLKDKNRPKGNQPFRTSIPENPQLTPQKPSKGISDRSPPPSKRAQSLTKLSPKAPPKLNTKNASPPRNASLPKHAVPPKNASLKTPQRKR